MMETMLKGVPGIRNYLDDIIVYAASPSEHDKALHTVIQKLADAGLTLNMQKNTFNQTSLKFLGHVISKEGILQDTAHIKAIVDAPTSHDLTSLPSFFGLILWYSKFFQNFATEVEPLRALLRNATETEFEWTAEADQCFNKLKAVLVESPVLALFEPSLPMIVSSDALDYGLGGVLTQLHADGVEHTLSAAERKYSTVEKEALACMFAVEKWRPYLWGHHFTLCAGYKRNWPCWNESS